ncbi:nickel pincer cofactor biosynthesis protein LarB [Neobacillus cucumis]|uniref:nickel pincer cofactor biosynthesis protein LarB n=1 Tax=Neobacillus cucumis TaxID=1740721 RepID=UPI002E224B0A|nr:nickel pincer cofactor biosynthesis protein LarB [Neobacillus cucumis]MED4224498.1 nickel pincer cofactor biosynthesis protein LarB [Neobacillus cucumis]
MSEHLKKILEQVSTGEIESSAAYDQLKNYEDFGYVKVDQHRAKRKGFPEVIYGASKTAKQIIGIFQAMIKTNEVVLATRVSFEKAQEIVLAIPELQYYEESGILLYSSRPLDPVRKGPIGIICAGTSDYPVAQEAALTAKAMGNEVIEIYDIGVAGIHRLFHHLDEIKKCSVLIVIAGMEGALPSVMGGLVQQPIIAVPTSVGYGAHLNGLTALLAMLNSCASGITVVNIDNGFGAAYSATLINQMIDRAREL